MKSKIVLAMLLLLLSIGLFTRAALGQGIPLIYSTDLYYNIKDIDDHFDAAVVLKSPEFDTKAIILDNHFYPNDGDKVLAQLMSLTGRQVPVAKGLGLFKMRSFEDKGLYVHGEEAIDLILKILKESPRKVRMIAVGSMTDFAVAYLRDPALFKEKVEAVYVVAGSAESPEQDYNVELDPKAFVVLMRSSLPVIWVPVDSSMWYFPATEMLVPEKNQLSHFLLNELLYWYIRNDEKQKQGQDRYDYYHLGRWMWSTPAFVHACGSPQAGQMFDLIPAKVDFDDAGVMKSIKLGVEGSNLRVVKNVHGTRLNQFMVERINR